MVISNHNDAELYGGNAAADLLVFHRDAVEASREFAELFYGILLRQDDLRAILERLDEQEFAHLRTQQAEHLTMLTSPALDAISHRKRAVQVGRIHALVGVEIMWLTEAYGLYQKKLHDILMGDAAIDPLFRHRILQLIDRRLLVDLQAQSEGYRKAELEVFRATAAIQQQALKATSVVDLYQGALKALCGIDGVTGAFVSRMGRQRILEVEVFEGAAAHAYLNAMQGGEIPQLSVQDAGGDLQDGPTSKAWRTGQIHTTSSYGQDATVRSWSIVGSKLGFRSSAAIPLVDETGQTFALINLYSRWPGFFETAGRRAFLEQVQQSISITAARHSQGSIVSHSLRQTYRSWLTQSRIRLLYQPIVDLRSGRLLKVEALARLIADDGRLISPADFLQTLGGTDLLRLFAFGVQQACNDHRIWHAQGINVGVSINLPPQAVGDSRYHDVLFTSLEASGIDTEALSLEILESGGAQDSSARDTFFETLKVLGIRMVQDDLGSGHSSLLRLDSMPFDEVKIDQGLVLGAARKDPERAFTFIQHLTQLAHALNMTVTVEGLEHAGLIEAAAILGADHGQGYGIARPMPADELLQWTSGYRHSVDLRAPGTPWGALAGYLLWDQQLQALDHWPDLIDDFVNAPCLVEKFIARQGLHGSGLDRLLQENHERARPTGSTSEYQSTRRLVIEALAAMGPSH